MAKTKIDLWPVDQVKALMYLNPKQVRQMYTQYRDIAQKRLHRMQEEFGWTQAVKTHPHGFRKLKDLSDRDLPKAFAELSKFVTAKLSTVTGQREFQTKIITKWQKQGLNLNEGNYATVMKLMDEMHNQKVLYGSNKVVDVAEKMLELDPAVQNDLIAHLNTILEHSDEFSALDIPSDSGWSADEILDMLS